jgi:hypothetical protein
MITTKEIIEEIVGLNLIDGSKIARDNGFKFRIAKTDGKPMLLTRDYNINRINVEVKDNEIIEAYTG